MGHRDERTAHAEGSRPDLLDGLRVGRTGVGHAGHGENHGNGRRQAVSNTWIWHLTGGLSEQCNAVGFRDRASDVGGASPCVRNRNTLSLVLRCQMTVSERVRGVLLRPRSTFDVVVGAPQWLGILALCTVASAAAWTGLLATETGRIALVDQWERAAVATGVPLDDARYADLQRWSRYGAAHAAGRALVVGPGLALVGGLALWLAARRFGRATPATFRQCVALSSHAGVILAVRDLLAAPTAFARETTTSATTLGLWFAGLDGASTAARFLGSLDAFMLWWAALLGIGLAALCGVSARRAVAGTWSTLAAVAAVVALAVGLLGGD